MSSAVPKATVVLDGLGPLVELGRVREGGGVRKHLPRVPLGVVVHLGALKPTVLPWRLIEALNEDDTTDLEETELLSSSPVCLELARF